IVAANLPTWEVDERLGQIGAGGVELGFSLALIATLVRAQRSAATSRTATLAHRLGVPMTIVDEHLTRLAQAGFVAATQAGGWVLSWSPERATLSDLYQALALPLARGWAVQHHAPWQTLVARAMDGIVAAESAAMQVSLAALIAETGPRAKKPVGTIADAAGSE